MVKLRWGAATPEERGPVVASPAEPRHRNAIGSYSGAYAIYRALAVATGEVRVTKAAIDPVWHLPGLAERFGIAEHELRRTLFEETGGMFPELVTRPDLEVFLPPIGGTTVYLMGDVNLVGKPKT